jgi:5-methylcytosine-specific restriction protein A
MRYCTQPGCSQLVVRGYCPQHAQHRRPYFTRQWKELRAQVLADAAYTCADCGTVQLRLEVDHITPHAGDPLRFWAKSNLQALCPPCHTRKTKAETSANAHGGTVKC